MPPSRRHPRTAQPPARRPRVAGLRRPGATAAPAVPDSDTVNDADVEATELIERVEPVDDADQDTTSADAESAPPVWREPVEGAAEEPHEDEEPQHRDVIAGPVISKQEIDEDSPDTASTPTKPGRPAGKRRSTGAVRPSDLDEAEAAAGGRSAAVAEESEEDQARARRNRTVNLAIAGGIVAILLAGLAFWFKGEADRLTEGADANNKALTDLAKTSEAAGQLRVAIEKTLSYNYTDLASTANAVKENLAGTALCEYDKLYGQVQKLAPEQKIVLTTKVREIGVTRLEGDTAEVLLFVDQTTTRADQNETTAAGGQFGIRAERQGGTWKIIKFDMFGQPLPNGQPAPTC